MKKIKYSTRAKIVAKIGLMALFAVLGCGLTPRASAIGAGDADTMINAYNNAFLVTSGNTAYYKSSISNGTAAGTWVASLDIMAEEDAYERTGSPAHKTLVNNLCATWLQNTQPPWSWDGWNDDIGWFTLALIRGYQMTGSTDSLTQAEYGFNYAYGRGWDTQYNGGGIWEQQPNMTPAGQAINKAALSNDSLGKVACLIYQSTHDVGYLNKAEQIYDWVWHNLYNPSNGQVYASIDRNGTVDTGTAVYNQGTFVDFANYLYQITGNVNYYNDAKRAIDYVRNNMTTGGVISNNAGYLNTWADEFARGLGHFCRDNRQWGTYYSWMVQNANAIMSSRRTDYNITWNGWTQQTPTDNTLDTSKFASAVAWMQFTPPTQPNGIAGTHSIVSKLNGIAIDNGGNDGNGKGVVLYGSNGGQNQKWNFTQNADTSWNIISQSSWQAMDDPGGSTGNNVQMIQWQLSRDSNQRWWVDQQADGSYKIWNQASSLALDSSSTSTNSFPLTQWPWNGGTQQRWLLQ